MGKLKVRLKYKDLEVEMVGEEETVKEEFNKIKNNGLENITKPIDRAESYLKFAETQTEKISEREKIIDASNIVEERKGNSYPPLFEILKKDLPSSERDWILIYAFYNSNFGENSFSNKNIIDGYDETKRRTMNRIKNISGGLKYLLKKDYISMQNETDYLFKKEGFNRVNQILEGNVIKKVISKKSTKNSKKVSSSFNFKKLNNLDLRPDNSEHLIDFIGKYELNSFPEKITVIVYYLKKMLNVDEVSDNAIYTCLDSLGEKIPPTLRQIIINTKGKGWIDYDNYEDINLTIVGKNFVKHDIKLKNA